MVLVHLRSKEIVVFAGQAQAGVFLLFLFFQADVQAQALQLFEQNVEGFGDAGLTDGVALDDGFIGIDASGDVVGLDGEDLLQVVGGGVGFQGPHFHFAEALAAELGLAAQGLLGNH